MTAIPPGWTPEQARKRLEAATPGPWAAESWDSYSAVRTEPWERWTAMNVPRRDDAAFIAHAPTDIAALLALLDESREALEEIVKERFGQMPDGSTASAFASAFLPRFAAPEESA